LPGTVRILWTSYLTSCYLLTCRQVAGGVGLQPHLSVDSPDWRLLLATRSGHFTSEQLEEKVIEYVAYYQLCITEGPALVLLIPYKTKFGMEVILAVW